MKTKMAAAKKPCFCIIFCYSYLHLSSFKVRGFTNNYKFCIIVIINISSRHSNLNFAHHFLIYWLLQNGTSKSQHQDRIKEKLYMTNSYFFAKLVRQKKKKKKKKTIGWAKYVYICKWDVCWRTFCVFPWWLKMLTVGQK